MKRRLISGFMTFAFIFSTLAGSVPVMRREDRVNDDEITLPTEENRPEPDISTLPMGEDFMLTVPGFDPGIAGENPLPEDGETPPEENGGETPPEENGVETGSGSNENGSGNTDTPAPGEKQPEEAKEQTPREDNTTEDKKDGSGQLKLPSGYDWKPLIGPDGEPVSGDERWTLSYNFIVYENDEPVTATVHTEQIYDERDEDYLQTRGFTVITQINYKNTNQILPYNKGELVISVPNIMYGHETEAQIEYNEFIFAVGSSGAFGEYSWIMTNEGTDYMRMPYFTFTNNVPIDENANFEGTIQLTYTMYSLPEGETSANIYKVEAGFDDCEHTFTYNDRVMLSTAAGYLYSNDITYTFYRKYLHAHADATYRIKKSASLIKSAEGLLEDPDENAEDYYWVRWDMEISATGRAHFRLTRFAKKLKVADDFPDGSIILGPDLVPVGKEVLDGTEYYVLEIDPPQKSPETTYTSTYFIVGYPKEHYNETNPAMENTAYLYALMEGERDRDYEYQHQSTANINLGDFEFHYDQGYYAIGKEATSTDKKYFQSITGTDVRLNEPFTYRLVPVALYSGFDMDVLVGDDMLYIHSNTGRYRRLKDDEYYFSEIEFPSVMYNGNGQVITTEYEYQLFVRKANSPEGCGFDAYSSRGKGTYSYGNGRTFRFTKDDRVVAYYFRIYRVHESIAGDMIYNADGSITLYNNYTRFLNTVVINDAVRAQTAGKGRIYNFDWINVFDEEGVHQNVVDRSTYGAPGNGLTQSMLADQDMDYYDHYMQRSAAFDEYETMSAPTVGYILWAEKSMTNGNFQDDPAGWPLSAVLNLKNVARQIPAAQLAYLDGVKDEDLLLGWEFIDPIPEYVTVTSTPEEIIDSFYLTSVLGGTKFYVKNENGVYTDLGNSGFVKFVKEHTTVDYIYIEDTPILRIIIDISDNPMIISGFWTGGRSASVTFEMNFKVNMFYDYEGYLSDKVNGRHVDNRYYGYYHDRRGLFEYGYYNTFNLVYANGYVARETRYDYNGNGVLGENMVFGDAGVNVSLPTSTYINIIKEVADKKDETEFTTGMVSVDYDEEYLYRLSVVTGNNRLTNITLYDFIEENAMDPEGNIVPSAGNKDYWTGQFAGIDLTDALGKSYIDNVDVYYSDKDLTDHWLYIKNGENAANGGVAGAVLNSEEWHLYKEGVTDPSSVRSLALDFKNKDGSYSVMPAYEKLSITLVMSAPYDKEYYSYAYNGFFTQWVALSNVVGDEVIPGIGGLNSNIVSVALPHSGQASVNVEIEKAQALVVNGVAGTPTKDKLEVKAGDIVRYFITLTCDGTMPAKDLFVTDQVPAGLQVLDDTISHGGEHRLDVVMWHFDQLSNVPGENKLVLTFDVRVPDDSDQASWENMAQAVYDDNHDPDDPRENKKSNKVEIERLGMLKITKIVTGLDGDTRKKFTFRITLIPPEGVTLKTLYPTSSGSVSTGGYLIFNENDDGSIWADIELSHNQTLTIINLPRGTRYIIEELGYEEDGYRATVSGDDDDTEDIAIGSGYTRPDATAHVVFTNEKGEPGDPKEPDKPPRRRRTPDEPGGGDIPDTSDDSSPLLWVCVLALSVIMVAFIKKRHRESRQ